MITSAANKRARFGIWTVLLLLLFSCSQKRENPIQHASLPPVDSDQTILELHTEKGIKSYSLNRLEGLGLKRLSTSTFWSADDGSYEGILLADLLKDAGLYDAEELLMTAFDGYTLIMPREKWTQWPAFLATRRDGSPLELKEKGPTRILFPRDMDNKLKSDLERTYWIWSLKTIEEKR